MTYINVRISGIPYPKIKSTGNKNGPKDWAATVIAQTKGLQTVDGPCMMRVTFLLPPDKFTNKKFPYGPDVDNYLKNFQDAIKETIFVNAPGGDSCIIHIEASKVRVDTAGEAGAHLEVLPHVPRS